MTVKGLDSKNSLFSSVSLGSEAYVRCDGLQGSSGGDYHSLWSLAILCHDHILVFLRYTVLVSCVGPLWHSLVRGYTLAFSSAL